MAGIQRAFDAGEFSARTRKTSSKFYEKSRLTTDVDVTGLVEVMRQLEKFPKEIQERIEKRELKKASTRIKDEATRLVPVGDTGNLAAGISLRIKRRPRMVVGQIIARAPHSHLIEFGHRMVTHKPAKEVVGFVPPTPFMRPALISKGDEVLRDLAAGVQKAMMKLEKKGA